MPHYLRKLAVLALLSVFLALPVAGAALADVDAGAETGIATSPHAALPSIDNPAAVIDAARDARTHGGLIAVIGLAAFILGGALLRASGHVGWLAQGRRLAAITALTTVGAAVFDCAMQGGAWLAVVVPITTAIALVISPVHPPASGTSAGA